MTNQQKNAVNVNGGVLVSASAGSGKTMVLTNRVLRLLKEGVTLDNLVIVTFTVASAEEMKERIQKELLKEADNDFLYQQQMLLPKAHISTIDSYCTWLLKNNFQKLSLDPNFRMADTAEINVIIKQACEEVFEIHYKEESFQKLVEFFCGKSDKELFDIFSDLYNYIRSFPHPKRYLKECIKAYQTDTDIWVNQIYDYIKIAVEQIKKNSDDALNLCDEDQDVFDKYNEFLSKERKKIDDIYILTENKNWDELLCCINKIEFETIPSKIRGLEICERIKSLREGYKEIILKLKKDILICTKEEHQKDIAILCPIIKMLCEIEEEIYDLIEEKKSQQNMLDFPDLEHLAIKLLTNENGEKSDICKQLNSQIKEIMVDECQDINAVQNYIFTLLSNNEDNIFMVGDVKQSIYRFRKAMPELFVKKKKEYPLYSDDKTQNRSTVILDKNFRSRSEVCTFVNKIFEVIMQGEIYYEDPLQCGTSFPENNQAIPEICLLEKECTHSEEEFIALKIEQMIKEGYTVYDWENGEYNARPCRYSDFCILLRSKKDRVLPYQKELEKRNIPNFCDYSQGYFNEYEISVILNFLRVIDNPLLDVPLLSVMMSPIFSFSADDVAKIRKGKKKKSLYSCLLESEYKDLINILEEFRKKATLLSPEELLQEIYDTTDFIELCYALDKGEQKDVNLRLLISYAKKYQQYSNGGLSGFLHYIDTIIEKKEDFLSANVFSKSENSVKIMSIHSSKGLEFPIVIVANCDKKFNAMDEKKFIQFNPNLFIGTAIKDDLHKYDTIPKKAVQLANKTQAVCEEMRCLYVALTRAKEKIIVVASKYNSKKEPESIGLYNILKAGSFIKWILMAISEQSGFYKQAIITDDYFKNDISIEKAKVTATIDQDLLVRLQKNFNFKYKNEELTKISAKITATQMAKEEISIKSEPTFIIENGLTSAMKGTALHNFMQYANFHNAENNLLQEIQRLVMQEFITKEQADVLDENSIKMFLSSNLYQRIKKSKQVYREFPFLHFIDSGLINSDVQGHEVLIQGIADLIFIEDDKAVIVDYKTDRVSNENMLVERYKNQLEIYKKAIAQVLNIKVKQAYIYSMNMSKEILI